MLTQRSLSPAFYRSDLPGTLTQSAHLNGSRPTAQNPAAYNEWGPLGYRLAEDNFRIEYVFLPPPPPSCHPYITRDVEIVTDKICRISMSR